jgi:hypothetical protein
VIARYGEELDAQEAERVFRQMNHGAWLSPDAYSYGALLTAFAKVCAPANRQFLDVKRIWRELVGTPDIFPNLECHNG